MLNILFHIITTVSSVVLNSCRCQLAEVSITWIHLSTLRFKFSLRFKLDFPDLGSTYTLVCSPEIEVQLIQVVGASISRS